jgi:membrane-bound inhibitor of C-type lysozyme/heat shock protein HslJ
MCALLAALALAGCSSDPAGSGIVVPDNPYGSWRATEIGALTADATETTLEIGEDGTIGGQGGCNGYSGNATIVGGAIQVGPIAATKMACEPAIMEQETVYFEALGKTAGWRREAGALVLTDAQAFAVARFEPMSAETAAEDVEAGEAAPEAAAADAGAADAGAEAAAAEAEAALTAGAIESGPSVEEIAIALPQPAPFSSTRASYDCDGRIVEAEYLNAGSVRLVALTIDGQFVVAANVLAASGARYSGGQYVWWTKGDEADLIDYRNGGADEAVSCERTG